MKRSFDPAVLEMMDRPQPVSAELERDLERIRQLNRWFGSYRLILGFIRRWIRPDTHARIVDLATGSGDIPRLIADCARDVGAQVEIDALDRQPATLEIANNLSSDYPEIFYREANILEWNSGEAYDIVLCTLAPSRRLSFDRADFSRTDDAPRRPTLCRSRIFVFRNARSRPVCRLETLWSQEISIRAAGHLAGKANVKK